MEVAVLIGVFLLVVSSAKRSEVLSRLGYLVLVELHAYVLRSFKYLLQIQLFQVACHLC